MRHRRLGGKTLCLERRLLKVWGLIAGVGVVEREVESWRAIGDSNPRWRSRTGVGVSHRLPRVMVILDVQRD